MSLYIKEAGMDDSLEVWKMLAEIGPGENGFQNNGYNLALEEFPWFLMHKVDESQGYGLKPGQVPQTTYWLYRDGYPIGVSKLRHYLNENLLRCGGHIGYCIRPTERGKNYGKLILALTLEKAREKGINRALITCNEDNIASRKVAESIHGLLTGVQNKLCYYWVNLRAGLTE